MTRSASDAEPNEGMPPAVKWAIGLSVFWFVVLFFLLEGSEACQGAAAVAWWNVRASYLACRKPNELADFLAGAFAPVAFLWLVATVFLQSQELRAQRRELSLTRQELELSRTVAAEQREAMRSQALEAAAQTRLLEDESDHQRRVTRTRNLEAALESFLHEVMHGELGTLPCQWPGSEGVTLLDLRTSIPEMTLDDQIRSIGRELCNIEATRAQASTPMYFEPAARWSRTIEEMANEELTTPGRLRFGAMKLNDIARVLSLWAKEP